MPLLLVLALQLSLAHSMVMPPRTEPRDPEALNRILAGVVNGRDVTGVVARVEHLDGRLIWEGASGDLQATDPWFAASVSKMFVATLALQLHAEGRLPLETRVASVLPADVMKDLHVLRGRDYSGTLTLRHLLAHRSGLPDYFTGKDAKGQRLDRRLLSGVDTGWSSVEAIATARGMAPRFVPGSAGKAHYSDTNYHLVGLVLEQVTGQPLEALLRTRIIEPLGLRDTYLYTDPTDTRPAPIRGRKGPLLIPRAMASFGPDGGIVSTSADLARFTRAFFSAELFPESLAPEIEDFAPIFFPFKAGLGIWQFHLPRWSSPFSASPTLLGHGGLSGSFAFVDRERQIVVVGTVNSATSSGRPYRLLLKLLKSVDHSP